MEVPLSPLEFARRTRRLHGDREAVVDGGLRLTYEELFDRCDRWSAALQGLGVSQGDRVATIAPNTHAQLEAFSSVPQLGPCSFRSTTASRRMTSRTSSTTRGRRSCVRTPTTWTPWTASGRS